MTPPRVVQTGSQEGPGSQVRIGPRKHIDAALTSSALLGRTRSQTSSQEGPAGRVRRGPRKHIDAALTSSALLAKRLSGPTVKAMY